MKDLDLRSLRKTLTETNWAMFERQKRTLADTAEEVPVLWDILYFIDAIQDAVVKDGLLKEVEVFPSKYDRARMVVAAKMQAFEDAVDAFERKQEANAFKHREEIPFPDLDIKCEICGEVAKESTMRFVTHRDWLAPDKHRFVCVTCAEENGCEDYEEEE